MYPNNGSNWAGAQGLVATSPRKGRIVKSCRRRDRRQATVHRTVAVSHSSPCTKTEKVQHRKVLDFFWQGHKDLNPEPTVLETAALPIELYPYI